MISLYSNATINSICQACSYVVNEYNQEVSCHQQKELPIIVQTISSRIFKPIAHATAASLAAIEVTRSLKKIYYAYKNEKYEKAAYHSLIAFCATVATILTIAEMNQN